MKTIFYNGNIITMDNKRVYSSMLIEGEKIKILSNNKIEEDVDLKIDLKGKTILPGFVDSHSHITSVAMSTLQVDLDECNSIDALKEKLKDYKEKNHCNENDFVIGISYEHNNFKEKRHPSRAELDEVFPSIPLVVEHKSNHFGVFNSKAIELLNLTTEDGYLQETEFVDALKKIPMPNIERIVNSYTAAQNLYASYGITTLQDGMIVNEMTPIYKYLLGTDKLFLDIIGYINYNDYDNICTELVGKNKHFSIGGYKIILDGSPQGKTAWMLAPYKDSPNYCGSPLMSDAELRNVIKNALDKNITLLAHCNGDAAVKQYIDVLSEFEVEKVRKNKFVIVHSQLIDTNQLEIVEALGMIPSFFIAHTYYYGDVHIKNFGFERASKISPAKSSLDKGIKFTFHQDSPVIKPNMFETIWCSLKRETKSGVIIGGEEKIDLYNALLAVTLNSAYQYGLENEIGSLEVNKKADFIIISEDIFNIDVDEIKNIQVEKTYKEGILVYENGLNEA